MTRATHHSLTCRTRQIYNMACPASPVHYQYNPVKTFKTSVIGTMNMLGLAKRVKARILQASTSEVYGDPEISPQTEDYWGHVNCNGVRSCYDEGKRSAETLCFDYHRQNNVDIRVARIFNTYGPGMHPYDGRVVSNFLVQAINGEDITVYGRLADALVLLRRRSCRRPHPTYESGRDHRASQHRNAAMQARPLSSTEIWLPRTGKPGRIYD